jgi:transketolase
MVLKATRDGFGEALVSLAKENEKLIVLSADLSKATKTAGFAKAFPERFFECGIAECNAIGIASGLSENGFYPVFSSFASFLTGKYDVIRVSLAYSNATALLVGTHAGMAIGKDGVTQMGLEDVTLMRALPNMKVYQPATANQTKQMLREIVKLKGPSYFRIGRQSVPEIFDEDTPIDLDKIQVISDDGDVDIDLSRKYQITIDNDVDVCFITSGCVLHDVIEAAEELRAQNKKVSVLNVHTIKPLDVLTLEEYARKSKNIVTVEDHSIVGGLGSLVCEALTKNNPCKILRIGLEDVFPESAPPNDLYEKYGLNSSGIVAKVQKYLRKNDR